MLKKSDLYSTKCFLFSLKCTKIVCGWGSAPDPAGEAAQRSPDHEIDSLDVMGYWYEICEFTELIGLPGCVPDLTGNNNYFVCSNQKFSILE